MKLVKYLVVLLFLLLFAVSLKAAADKKETFNPKETIFEHIEDEYGWTVGRWKIPLPVILIDDAGKWHAFSSKHIVNQQQYKGFYIATDGEYEGKIVSTNNSGEIYRPWDFSMTKNVLALLFTAFFVCWAIFPLVRWYKKENFKAPRRVRGIMEMVIEMLYNEVIVGVLGKDARRYAPYLLTTFFFILFANLLGQIVVFPGGANITGNLSVTLVLAVCTFVVVNVSGTKEYWKDIFWPEVPAWLKFPVPMMPLIELFGIFTKPIALMVRLFANILGGHLITLVLVSLIFVFGAFGAAAMGTATVVSVLFTVFMNLIDLLICFIQAYVFMMLSTIFISLARVR